MNIFQTIASFIDKNGKHISDIFWIFTIFYLMFGWFFLLLITALLNSWPFIDPNNCSWPQPSYFETMIGKPWLFGSLCLVGTILKAITTFIGTFAAALFIYIVPFGFGILLTIIAGLGFPFFFNYYIGQPLFRNKHRILFCIAIMYYPLFSLGAACLWTKVLFEDFWMPINFLLSFY